MSVNSIILQKVLESTQKQDVQKAPLRWHRMDANVAMLGN